jgi:hypothetical protein
MYAEPPLLSDCSCAGGHGNDLTGYIVEQVEGPIHTGGAVMPNAG